MATEPTDSDENVTAQTARLQQNLARIEVLSARLMQAVSQKKQSDTAIHGPSADLYAKACAAYFSQIMQNPAKLIEQQVSYWGKTLSHYAAAQQALAKGDAPPSEPSRDKRFKNPLWDSHPAFNFLKQQYLFNADAITQALGDLPDLDPNERRRVDFFTRQIVDFFAPTNFLATNPDALEKALATEGESLVAGLENLVRDLEANQGDMLVTLSDPTAFTLGENIATTPGKVVFRNRMFELLQYAPQTETVYDTPLLIFPPWINKYYILDLKPQNSMVGWLLQQGYSVFVVSWINPDRSYADVAMDDYIREGFLQAIAEVQKITKRDQINAVGYCISGTTLSATLAHLKQQGKAPVRSATFLATLTDFSDPGEVGVFLSDDFLDGIERQAERDGVLSKLFMSRTFSFLRSNELVYQPAIRSYMLGEPPPAFDLLHWNGDATHLPAKMAVEYLRELWQGNGLVTGKFRVFGDPVSLSEVDLPLFAVACETDHIAHWRGSFAGVAKMGSPDKSFVLSQSGHIAGIINPPSKGKYGHYLNADGVSGTPEDWMAGAEFIKGSWWTNWHAWLAPQSGAMIKARKPGDGRRKTLGDAPGSYALASPQL